MVSDGDGPFIPGIDDCVWIIAPPGADRIHLNFLFFDMSPDYTYNNVNIDVCDDLACSNPTKLQGSPFQMNPTAQPTREIPSASTGFVRVSFPAMWSGHTQARFVLHYSTDVIRPNEVPGIMTGSWHYITAVVESLNQRYVSVSIYLNGSLAAGPVLTSFGVPTGLAPVGQDGIALGRRYPMSPPFGYFKGWIDELVVMDRNVSRVEMAAMMKATCSQMQHTVLCFSFDKVTVSRNGSFLDLGSGLPSNAVPVSQDRFQPWCYTRNDGGELVLDYIVNEEPYGASWGFCTTKPRLPGLGFNYNQDEMYSLINTFNFAPQEFHLGNFPGCANTPLIFSRNTAVR